MTPGILLTRAELQHLTDRRQAAAMAAWLHRHNWVYERGDRPGDLPKVSRAYFDARMSGTPMPGQQRSGPRVDFFTGGVQR